MCHGMAWQGKDHVKLSSFIQLPFVRNEGRSIMLSERTLRNRAHEIGYHISKGFTHCFGEVMYDDHGARITGYMVMDTHMGFYVRGYDSIYDHTWNLQDVEDFLREEYESLGLEW